MLNFLFVQVHTNNTTDKLFKHLRGGYCNRDMLTYDELIHIIDDNVQIKVNNTAKNNYNE